MTEDPDWGDHLAKMTTKTKVERAEREKKRKRDQREQEELVAMGRTVTMETVKKHCYIDFKLMMERAATAGDNECKIIVSVHPIIEGVVYTLFDWECKEVAAWIQAKFAGAKGLHVKRAGSMLIFQW